jgi:prepilin-type processing-associated H-X9-DG protein
LVELLVVIGIIGVLVALLLPSLNKARDNANKVKCMSNLKQMGLACMMYAQDNNSYLPARYWNFMTPLKNGWDVTSTFGPNAGFVASPVPGGTPPNGPALLVKAGRRGNGANYLEDNDVFFCPTDQVRAPYRSPDTGWGPTSIIDVTSSLTSISYWNYYLPERYWDRTSGKQVAATEVNQNVRLGRKNAVKKMIFTDQFIPAPPADASVTDIYKNFHNTGANVLYMDGHVAWNAKSVYTEYARKNPTAAYSTVLINAANEAY